TEHSSTSVGPTRRRAPALSGGWRGRAAPGVTLRAKPRATGSIAGGDRAAQGNLAARPSLPVRGWCGPAAAFVPPPGPVVTLCQRPRDHRLTPVHVPT